MTIEADFVAACVSAPTENAPRLVYGDWLMSNAPTDLERRRGELMVVQCRLAERDAGVAEEKKLRAVEKKLAKAVEREVAIGFAERLGYGRELAEALQVRVDVDRGFVTGLEAPFDVLGRLDAASEAAPLLAELRLGPLPAPAPERELDATLWQSPRLAQIERLAFGAVGIDDRALGLVAECPHLGGLRALAFNGASYSPTTGALRSISGAGLSRLVASPQLAKIQHLRFNATFVSPDGLQVITEAPWPLATLDLTHSAVGSPFDFVVRATHHTRLETLKLTGGRGTRPDQIRALVSAPHLDALRHLDIESCDLGVEGLEAMLPALRLPALEELIAASNKFGERGAELIAQSTRLAGLKRLDLTKNGFNKKGVLALASGPGLAGVEKLLLNERDSEEARKALAESKTLAGTLVYFRGQQVAKLRS